LDRLRYNARELRNNATDAERLLWRSLRGRQLAGFRFRRQMPIAGYIADFASPDARLVVELDGGQHADRIEYDQRRCEVMADAGYRIVRYWNHDVLTRTADVLADIHRHLTSATPSRPPPSATRKGEE
jgi:very-short-patch-repair endonuclease